MTPRKKDGIGAWIEHKRMHSRDPSRPSVVELIGDGTAKVYLKGGEVAIVDEEDAPLVGQFSWYSLKIGSRCYARLSSKLGHKLMHRILIPDAVEIDHRDGNGLNNRRSNIRPSTRAQNMWNRRKTSRQTLYRFKGVRASSGGRYSAVINFNGVRKYLGGFPIKEEAARAYDAAAIRLHGEFARLNFPKEER